MTITRMAAVGLLALTISLGLGTPAPADDKPVLSTAGSVGDALAKLGEGRDVEVVLAGGKSYRGKLGSVGKDTAILTQIVGKEFYDVLIVLDEIAAVEIKARGN